MSEDLLVDGYDYNPHTCMVEVPYNDYFDMKDKCKENKQLHSIIKEVTEYIEKELKSGRSKNNQWLMGCYDEDKNILEILDKVDKEDK